MFILYQSLVISPIAMVIEMSVWYRLIEGCPLSIVQEDATKTSSPHVTNLNSISKRSLYMESMLCASSLLTVPVTPLYTCRCSWLSIWADPSTKSV